MYAGEDSGPLKLLRTQVLTIVGVPRLGGVLCVKAPKTLAVARCSDR